MAGCPICGKPGAPDYRPFCSRRCADVDLARWLRGDYVIPGPPADTADGEEKPNPDGN
ncbi:DNA gyrase inhibitor YacG [Paracoccus zhejiangensis]|uniref:DNA gyrase inhibitor YacG n=1 Tax=Paracoccus zhejiangensis TaxID=1077935 RepID=A0A2H5EY07_9RHOB|nr:DNA gyrase inhibitor YacG [Paracoccus zhejiangensis]AUH64153.1 DNA gyrase inhibitor YacG [Paracoccus zhejiangensis]